MKVRRRKESAGKEAKGVLPGRQNVVKGHWKSASEWTFTQTITQQL